MNLTKLNNSKISFSSKNLVIVDGNKNTEKIGKIPLNPKNQINKKFLKIWWISTLKEIQRL